MQDRHIEAIRKWRNSQIDVLRQSETISPDQQRDYFVARIWPDMTQPRPANILLIFEESECAIGYGGLVHIAWEHRRAEISFLLNPVNAVSSNAYAQYFSVFLRLLKELAFDDLAFNRLFAETYATREHHISVLEHMGFLKEGQLKHHVIIGGQPVDSIVHGCLAAWQQ